MVKLTWNIPTFYHGHMVSKGLFTVRGKGFISLLDCIIQMFVNAWDDGTGPVVDKKAANEVSLSHLIPANIAMENHCLE